MPRSYDQVTRESVSKLAIARLSHVALVCPRNETQKLLTKLCEFGEYHPLDRDGLVQDIEVLILSSKAQGIYADATHLLPPDYTADTVPSSSKPVTFEAKDPSSLLDLLAKKLESLGVQFANSDVDAKKLLTYDLEAIRETALALFNDLSRMRFSFEDKRFVILEGFIPTKKVESFRNVTKDFLISSEPVDKDEAKKEEVPSMFSNPRSVSLFENVTLLSGFPKYNEIDPTPVTAVVFPLFFGIMFSDLGHGIVLLLFGYALTRWFKGSYNYWGRLIMVLGSASIVLGFIRGSFFGYQFSSPLRLLIPLPSVLNGGFSIASVSFWIEFSIILGTFHLSTGYALSLLNSIHSREYARAFLSGLPTLFLYGSGVPLMLAVIGAGLHIENILSISNPTPFFNELLGIKVPISQIADISLPVFLFSIVMLVVGRMIIDFRSDQSRWRIEKSIVLGLVEGLVKPFEFFVNTLSYVRLGILLILGTILVTLSIGVISLGFIGIIAAIFANIAIMSIEGFMVYIQDLRLHVYEWFSNFFSGSGTPFEPMVSKGLSFSVHWT